MVQDALGRLQAKVDEEIGDSDLETRYNLGIAYKEMGLLGESLKEFRIATRRADLRLGATSLIADVLAEQGDVESAVAELDALIGSGHIDSTGIRDVRYHKAILLEKAGRPHEAADIFLAISAESPGYRDVRARAERLGR
jgi:tetratricopeptide (TPR) repeat protein